MSVDTEGYQKSTFKNQSYCRDHQALEEGADEEGKRRMMTMRLKPCLTLFGRSHCRDVKSTPSRKENFAKVGSCNVMRLAHLVLLSCIHLGVITSLAD